MRPGVPGRPIRCRLSISFTPSRIGDPEEALRLRNGTITLAGALANGAGSLAVTGGTGAYAGARGTYSETAKPLQVLGEDGPSRHRATIVFAR